ncbi:MAG: cell wall hydrolase [Lachnospira eligens]
MNRVADPRFANSISGVIYAPYQFSLLPADDLQ